MGVLGLVAGLVCGLVGCGIHQQKVPILMFHRVALDSPGDLWTLQPVEFERILRALQNAGYHPVFPDEIVWRGFGRHSPVTHPVILTFDDGDLTLLTRVEPALKRFGFKAIAYLSTANIADTPEQRVREEGREYLTWSEIQGLRERGVFEFGAHGHRHIRADQVMDPTAEIRVCLEAFETRGGFRPTSFSYPFGVYTKSLVAALRKAGFTTALTCTEKPASIAFGAKPLKLPRIWVRGVGPPFDLSLWMQDDP